MRNGDRTMAGRVKAIMLAGGLGTRLRPLTDTIPKCLVPIAGRPLLDYWVDRLVDAGVREARVNTHAHAEQVRDYCRSRPASGRLRLVESYEPELLGSAGTIAANAELADGADEVIIIYADNFSDVDLRPDAGIPPRARRSVHDAPVPAPDPVPAGSPSWTTRGGSSRSSRSRRSRRATWPTAGSTSSMPTPTARSPR